MIISNATNAASTTLDAELVPIVLLMKTKRSVQVDRAIIITATANHRMA